MREFLPEPTINYEIRDGALASVRHLLRRQVRRVHAACIAPLTAWLMSRSEKPVSFSFPRHIGDLTDEAVIVMLRQGARGGLSVAFHTPAGKKREQRHGAQITRNRHPADVEAEQRAYRDIQAAMQKWFTPSRKRNGEWA